MNRRKFLATLGIGVATAKFGLLGNIAAATDPGVAPADAVIGAYNKYFNFSDFAIASSIDECVAAAALELGRLRSKSIAFLYSEAV